MNDEECGRWAVDGSKWHSFSIPVQGYNGEDVTINIKVVASGWAYEYAFLRDVWFYDEDDGVKIPCASHQLDMMNDDE